jgi:hypothetical protein
MNRRQEFTAQGDPDLGQRGEGSSKSSTLEEPLKGRKYYAPALSLLSLIHQMPRQAPREAPTKRGHLDPMKGRVGFSERGLIFRTPDGGAKNYALVFKVAFPKLMSLRFPTLLPYIHLQ